MLKSLKDQSQKIGELEIKYQKHQEELCKQHIKSENAISSHKQEISQLLLTSQQQQKELSKWTEKLSLEKIWLYIEQKLALFSSSSAILSLLN